MNNNNNFWTNSDLGLLIIRVTLGGIIFFHGFHKLTHGLDEQIGDLVSGGLPGQLIYFVYVSEVLAPVLIVLGVLTRLSSVSIIATMIVVFYVLPFPIGLDAHGALTIESQLFFLLLPIALFFTGPGRYTLKKNNSGNWLLD
jgi:putative oxidoreductase